MIHGDGTAVRSYLYAADLAQWLLVLLVRGVPGRAYNVGSNQPVTITGLAQIAASLALPPVPVKVLGGPSGQGSAPVYLPVIDRAVGELGLAVRTPLPEALARTLAWYRSRPEPAPRW